MTRERRRYPRRQARIVAFQQVGGRRVRRAVTSVSTGGLHLAWDGPRPRAGALLVLELEREERPGAVVKVTAEVVHAGEAGVGVRVTRADWEQLSRLLGPPA